MKALDGIRGPLPYVAVISLAILLQGMVLWQFLQGDALQGMRGMLVGAVVVASNGLLAAWRRPRAPRESLVVVLALAVAVVWLVISLGRGPVEGYALWKVQGFILFAALPAVVVAWNLAGRQDSIRLLFRSMLVLSFVPLALPLLLLDRLGTGPLRWLLMTLDVDVIALGRSLGVGALLCVAALPGRGRILRGILALSAAAMAAAQILVGERGPVLALLAGLVVYVLLKLRTGRRRVRFSATAVVAVLLAAVALVSATAYLFQSRAAAADHEERRFRIVAEGWESWQASPLTGVGVGKFAYDPGEAVERQFFHNVVGEIGVELGLVGLAIFSLFFLAANRPRRRSPPTDEASNNIHTAAALLAFAVAAAMVSGDLATNAMVWVAQALLFAARTGGEATA